MKIIGIFLLGCLLFMACKNKPLQESVTIVNKENFQDSVRVKGTVVYYSKKMIELYNSSRYKEYTQFLVSDTYLNNSSEREEFIKELKRTNLKYGPDMQIIKILKFEKVDSLFNILFYVKQKMGQKYFNGFICGISSNNGMNWKFTEFLREGIHFEFILELIPSYTKSFASLIDSTFGTRIYLEVGNKLPNFEFIDLNNNKYESKLLKGNILVFNFWSTGCHPCIEEIPGLNSLVEKYKNDNVLFFAPCLTSKKIIIKSNFLKVHPFNYRIVPIDFKDYFVAAIPTHFIIDKDLNVVERIKGGGEDVVLKLDKEIAGLINK